MEKALLQEAAESCDYETGGSDAAPRPEWMRFVDEANDAMRLLHLKRTSVCVCRPHGGCHSRLYLPPAADCRSLNRVSQSSTSSSSTRDGS